VLRILARRTAGPVDFLNCSLDFGVYLSLAPLLNAGERDRHPEAVYPLDSNTGQAGLERLLKLKQVNSLERERHDEAVRAGRRVLDLRIAIGKPQLAIARRGLRGHGGGHVASFVSMPLAEPSYQANNCARLAGEESEPEDLHEVYTRHTVRDDNRPARADWGAWTR
jgi:hypothetical protein